MKSIFKSFQIAKIAGTRSDDIIHETQSSSNTLKRPRIDDETPDQQGNSIIVIDNPVPGPSNAPPPAKKHLVPSAQQALDALHLDTINFDEDVFNVS